MTTASERKFINLRKRLDQLGYRQPLGIESLPLVEKLFSDLVHTTESLRNAKLSCGKTEKEIENLDAVLEPYRTENGQLVRENNMLHQQLLKVKEESDHLYLKATVRKLEHDTADLKFLNNQYVHKVRSQEKDSKIKTEKIQQLQEKNLQAVVQTPGGKKRSIPFRRQRMQIDHPVPPSGISSAPLPHCDDPYVLDLLKVADCRIQDLQNTVDRLNDEQERADRDVRKFKRQIEARDQEIERLNRALEGGRPHDVISLESKNRSNERLIGHLNLQVEYLQRTNCDLDKQVKELQEKKSNAANELVNLSSKNEHLCNELNEIDHLAQQLEQDKEMALEIADKEIQAAKVIIKEWLIACGFRNHFPGLSDLLILQYLMEFLDVCHSENAKLQNDLSKSLTVQHLGMTSQHEWLYKCNLLLFCQSPERELVMDLERMRSHHGALRGDRSPSRLDKFVKSLEEERDYYKCEVEYLQGMVSGQSSPSLIRERDELQCVLEKFERHMSEIQCNVKMLTSERDKLMMLYEEAQEELTRLRKEATSPMSQRRMEEERDDARADLKRMTSERDSVRDRLKVLKDICYRSICFVCTFMSLENERFALKKKITTQKETISELEERYRCISQKLQQNSDNASHHKAELSSLRLVLINEQLEKSLTDSQHRLSAKNNELQSIQDQIDQQEDRLAEFSRQSSAQRDEMNLLRSTISALDKEKDFLQEAMDEKTERVANLEDNMAKKDKCITNMKITLTELESSIDRLNDSLCNREREVNSLCRQLDCVNNDLREATRTRDIALKESQRLQDDLVTMTRENQAINTELEEALNEKDELKSRVHNYITEVSRIENLMASKFRLASNQAESWELKAHQAEGESSSMRLELLSVDTERRHLEERVSKFEREIQEHISAQEAYEHEISCIAKSTSKMEEELRQTKCENSHILADLSSVRELCSKMDSNKDQMSRQLNCKNMELERVLSELDDVKSETELLKKQLSSERITIKNLETLLSSTREKEFQTHLSQHEKESEIQLLKDKLALTESKATSQNREISQLRNKFTQVQNELDVLKRQLTTERFERERAIQEMRRHGLSTSLCTSSPVRRSLSPLSRSQDSCSPLRGTERCTD
uniref:Centrosomal protein 135 n=1 Tax=Callorhinchus milii TaxID=7868 RepID=A0A4W3ITP8_CALMI